MSVELLVSFFLRKLPANAGAGNHCCPVRQFAPEGDSALCNCLPRGYSSELGEPL